MNARERLAAMIRTDRGDMTVWSPREVQDAINEFAAGILQGAADVAAAIHPGCDLKVCNACAVRHDILANLRSTAVVVGENPSREAAVRADALKLFLFHLEQSAGDQAAEKLLEDAPELTRLIEQGGGDGQTVTAPDFFQPGHTYRSDHIRMDDGRVWFFRCDTTSTRHDGSLVAQGPAYWAPSDGRPAKGAWMKLTYDMDGWRGGWTDVTEGGS